MTVDAVKANMIVKSIKSRKFIAKAAFKKKIKPFTLNITLRKLYLDDSTV